MLHVAAQWGHVPHVLAPTGSFGGGQGEQGDEQGGGQGEQGREGDGQADGQDFGRGGEQGGGGQGGQGSHFGGAHPYVAIGCAQCPVEVRCLFLTLCAGKQVLLGILGTSPRQGHAAWYPKGMGVLGSRKAGNRGRRFIGAVRDPCRKRGGAWDSENQHNLMV
uniref:Uncharacterized protein n=1 Tax=Chromera velia CCMP2878 TaxID=1169474 RepID=A0A0G4FA27_9ALVE|eukprot:Cvel_15834.t1-p1 / transcript=Cvel_15834.t1 / gene=Cvel_15834 / organism=Chromera_velia_CCMP2878 / gene_product=hypothetical protein / transcript_product=hypothetical protein / location=Cvel_scaffold1190:22208-22693(+) / protein_length=162 / sequence_SO=supercontig / SO=protein_coding / is_pseudo=false